MERVFVMVSAILFIMTNELLGMFLAAQDIVIDEVHEAHCMRSMPELEVETLTVALVRDAHALLLRIALQNELLEE